MSDDRKEAARTEYPVERGWEGERAHPRRTAAAVSKEHPFGDPKDWKPFEDACDDIVKQAFPDVTAVEKYGAGIRFHNDGQISVLLRGEERFI